MSLHGEEAMESTARLGHRDLLITQLTEKLGLEGISGHRAHAKLIDTGARLDDELNFNIPELQNRKPIVKNVAGRNIIHLLGNDDMVHLYGEEGLRFAMKNKIRVIGATGKQEHVGYRLLYPHCDTPPKPASGTLTKAEEIGLVKLSLLTISEKHFNDLDGILKQLEAPKVSTIIQRTPMLTKGGVRVGTG